MKPRPGIFLTLAYGAGLATGLLHFGTPLGASLLLASAPVLGQPFPTLLATAAMLGRMSGELAWLAERSQCATSLRDGRVRIRLRLIEPAVAAGGPVMVSPLGGSCRGTVSASWPARHPLGAGVQVSAEGRWIARPGVAGRAGGTLVVTSFDSARGRPPLGARLRTALTESSGSLYGARAPLVDALVLGRRGGIDPVLQQRFADAGLVHLLSISGFHVGLITAWVFLVGRLARLGRSRALVVAAAASVAYVAFLG